MKRYIGVILVCGSLTYLLREVLLQLGGGTGATIISVGVGLFLSLLSFEGMLEK